MGMPWLENLKRHVEKKPIVVLKFDAEEWEGLHRHGISDFTIARSHALLQGVGKKSICIVLERDFEASGEIYLGKINSCSPITTLESRIKIIRCRKIQPGSMPDLLRLLSDRRHASNLERRMREGGAVFHLSAKLSSYLLEKLASIEDNLQILRTVSDSLKTPKKYVGNLALQEDAIKTALTALGLTMDSKAVFLDFNKDGSTALTQIRIREDSVIAHDARHFPGYGLKKSDLTGRAVFEHEGDRLEIFTANRCPLEECFGVDLIYLSLSKRNIVMVQYKMLERQSLEDDDEDWIFRPDEQFEEEIRRMKKFELDHSPGPHEYRLNPTVFYLKFVKRDANLGKGGIVIPIDHFERLRSSPASQGPKGGLRVSYNSLSGCYLRQTPFLDLIKSGYIGAYASETQQLKVLIDAVLSGNRSVVGAIQRLQKAH
jgi:hypothetical protein